MRVSPHVRYYRFLPTLAGSPHSIPAKQDDSVPFIFAAPTTVTPLEKNMSQAFHIIARSEKLPNHPGYT